MLKESKNNVKVNKTAVYSEYGIEYKNGKILAPEFGYINPLLINGNSKIGDGVYHFSTLPTNRGYAVTINGTEYTIKGTCPCHCDGCYATKGNYNYDSVIKSLALKTYLAMHYTDFVYRAINAQIKADGIEIVRVHASGDFFNLEYIEMWKRIASANKAVTMWTYTKNPIAEHAFDDISNFNVVKSVVSGKGFNFGHCDYILALYDYLTQQGKSVYICRCGIDKNQHCNNCTACAKSDYVLFVEHSTAYKAEKDSFFPILKALIESQDKSFLKPIVNVNNVVQAAN